MAQKNKIYTVTMHRFGDRETHSYTLGAYTKKALALDEAELERVSRGGTKYYPEVLEFEPNAKMAFPSKKKYKVILALPK